MMAVLYLQHQDEVVSWLVSLEQEVRERTLISVIKLEVLDYAGMLDEPQQDLLRDVKWLERIHL